MGNRDVNTLALIFILLAVLLGGCEFPLFSQPTEIVIPTSMVIVPVTLEPTSSPTVAPTATPYRPINAVVHVLVFNVRTGPSTVFPVLRQYPENAVLTVLGQAPGKGEWVLVQTSDHLSAWAMVEFINIQGDLNTVPFIEPTDAYKITGRVLDTDGNPVSGIGFAISQGTGADELRTDVETDKNGIFTGYIPNTATGTWLVGYISINCQTSNVVDANCHYSGTIQPDYQSLVLPQVSSLNFAWE
jgi:hypothetical protein